MFKKRSKVLAAVLAAALAFSGAAAGVSVSGVDASAASTESVSLVTKAVGNDGSVTKYTYNKMGLVAKAVTKYATVNVYNSGVSNIADEDPTSYTLSDGSEVDYDTFLNGYTYDEDTGEYLYNGLAIAASNYKATVTGTKSTKDSSTTVTTTKYTYNTSGKAKGMLSKAVTTETETTDYTVTYNTNDAAYNAKYSGSYTSTKTTTTTKEYTYKKKALASVTTVVEAPDYATYSNVTGYYTNKHLVERSYYYKWASRTYVDTETAYTDYTDAYDGGMYIPNDTTSSYATYTYELNDDTEYLNGGSYKDDKTTTTTVTTYTTKKNKPVKATSVTTAESVDVDMCDVWGDSTTSGNTTTYTLVGFETDEYDYTRNYGTVSAAYKYDKKGRLKKATANTDRTYSESYIYKNTTIAGITTTLQMPTVTYNGDKGSVTDTYTYNKSGNVKKNVTSSTYSDYYYGTETYKYATYNSGVLTALGGIVYSNEFWVNNTTKGTTTYSFTEDKKTTTLDTTYSSVTNGGKDPYKNLSQVKFTYKTKKIKSAYADQSAAQQWKLLNGSQKATKKVNTFAL